MLKQGEHKSWTESLAASCRQEPRKALTMAALASVLLVLWGRMLLTGDSRPAHAGAATVNATPNNAQARSARASATPHVTVSMNRGGSSLPGVKPAAGLPPRDDSRRKLREWMSQPVRPIARNLFAVKLEYYPRDANRPGKGVKTARDGEFWGRLEKSLLLQADQKDKRENLLANFKEQAGRLRLDSIVMGPEPKAMIDGKLVSEGEVVAAFRVLKIEPRRIIVEREGIRLEIQMR
jgi:hypothetical protein